MPLFRKYNREKKQQLLMQKQQRVIEQNLISSELMENLAVIQDIFSDTPDLVMKNFMIKQTKNQASLVYLNGLSDTETINNNVLKPLLFEADLDKEFDVKVSLGALKESNIWPELESAILEGCSVLFIDGRSVAYQLDTQGWPQRGIEDTSSESSLRGAHEGFIETSSTNIALIRRHIPNRELKIKEMKVGERGKTKVAIMYLADVANPEVLQELLDRINKLKIDCLINTASLAE